MSDTTTTSKKTRPSKKSAAPMKDNNRAAAWMNMTVPLKADKGVWKMRKGYAIFDSEQYPDPDGMRLVELAEKNGGEVTVTMQVTIRVNQPAKDLDIEDIDIFG